MGAKKGGVLHPAGNVSPPCARSPISSIPSLIPSPANFAPKMSVLELYSNIDENFNILKGYWDNCLNPGSETGGI
jgi:hypothetical protein